MCLPLPHIVHKNHRHYTIVHHLLLLSVVFFIRHRRHRRRTTTTTYSHLFFSFCAVIRSRIQATYVRSHANFVSSCWWFFFSSSSFVCLLLLTAVVLWLGNQFRSGAVRPSCSEDEKKGDGERGHYSHYYLYFFSVVQLTERNIILSFVCAFFRWNFPFAEREHHMCAVLWAMWTTLICLSYFFVCFCLVYSLWTTSEVIYASDFLCFLPAPHSESLRHRVSVFCEGVRTSRKTLISFEQIRFSRMVEWMPLNKWLHRLSFSSVGGNCLPNRMSQCQWTDITFMWIIQLHLLLLRMETFSQLDTSNGLFSSLKC